MYKMTRLRACKGIIHRGNCTKNKLYSGIEKPCSLYAPCGFQETIKAPHSQGDVVVFELNAGQQCVAMSLCALICHNMKGIGNRDDLKQIMHIGNQPYSRLSQLSRQSFLLLADLPSMLTALEKDYQLEYSES